MGLFKRKKGKKKQSLYLKRQAKAQAAQNRQTYRHAIVGGTYLGQLVPDQAKFRGWRLHEDTIEVVAKNPVNNSVIAPVIVYIKPDKAELLPQWGVDFVEDLVNDTLANTVKSHGLNVIFVNNIRRMSSDWVKEHQEDTERYTLKTGESHQENARINQQQSDLAMIAQELDAESEYLAIGLKYIVSATSIKLLDDFLNQLQHRLELRIPGAVIALVNGNVEGEMANIFNDPMDEPGRKMMFTTREFAGFYNIVTNGIEDPHGFYAGEQVGDISNSAVIWDMTNFKHDAVIATNNKFMRKRDYEKSFVPDDYHDWSGSDLWLNTLILQLVKEQPLEGRRRHVFTLALDPINLDDHLITSTAQIDLNKGGLNPFEMFGDTRDELDIFPANLAKWHEMTRQLAQQEIKVENEFSQESIGMTELTDLDDTLTQFYIDHHMWVKNPAHNRDKIRIVGIPSDEVPRLSQFIAYLTSAYDEASNKVTGDQRKANEYNKLLALFRQLDLSNGDLFDVVTDPLFSSLGLKPHTLLNYSTLSQRKGNILLVQLLNSFSAIANQTHEGDIIIIHGAQRITSLTQQYINGILKELRHKGVRIVFSYTSPAEMINQADFNHMSSADWVLTGHMTPDECTAYDNTLGNQRQMTAMIARNIQSPSDSYYYLRRGSDNVIFEANPSM